MRSGRAESVREARPRTGGLDPERVAATIERLRRRVEDRFPGSGLGRVCGELTRIAEQARATAAWIARPILGLRLAVMGLLALVAGGLAVTVVSLRTPDAPFDLVQFVQLLEAGINDVVLVGAGVFFLVTVETRIKRRRALQALHELRALAHVIDMHQLTKDPEWALGRGASRIVEDRDRTLTPFELSRYLDYCSEALALTGKIAALYSQGFEDDVSLQAVNEIESLTTGLSRKIWQKLMILQTLAAAGAPAGAADGTAAG